MTDTRFHASWTDIAALAKRREEWRALAEAAIEPNPFYGPDFLIASQTHLTPKQPVRCLIVEAGSPGGRLCALLPLQRPHGRDGLPFGALALYRNAYTCLTTPLILAEDAAAVLATALDFLERQTKRLLIPMVPRHRPFAALLKMHAAARNLSCAWVDGRLRPCVETDLGVEAYRARFWKKNIRAAERARLRRLGTLGHVEYRHIDGTDPGAATALDVFLALEAKGWKGERGTALASRAETLAFAKAALLPQPDISGASAMSRTKARTIFETLLLDGRPIAINVNLVAGDVGYAIKSAYDEAFASLGVGTLLDGLSVGLAAVGGPLARLDSCTGMGHPVRHRWRQQERIGRCLLGLAPGTETGGIARWLGLIGRFGVWRGYGPGEEKSRAE